jgi:hypothetical protein
VHAVFHNLADGEVARCMRTHRGPSAVRRSPDARLPKPQLEAVVDGFRNRGLVDPDGRFTAADRSTKQPTDDLPGEIQ